MAGGHDMIICLDPGHGGEDSGAVGPLGLKESDAALQIAKYIRHGLLDSDHEVICTRLDDKFVSLVGRCEIANVAFADLLLSIHCNAFSNPNAHGYEVWTSRGQTAADPIAERLFESIGEAFPRLAPRYDKTDGDSDKEAGFVVLTQSRMAAVLVETCFISNAIEERWLHDIGWMMRMAGAIISSVNRRN
jgi:N-acetylmuramoyl-L-alanine amidase